jgi:hypothetical protein
MQRLSGHDCTRSFPVKVTSIVIRNVQVIFDARACFDRKRRPRSFHVSQGRLRLPNLLYQLSTRNIALSPAKQHSFYFSNNSFFLRRRLDLRPCDRLHNRNIAISNSASTAASCPPSILSLHGVSSSTVKESILPQTHHPGEVPTARRRERRCYLSNARDVERGQITAIDPSRECRLDF